MKQQKTDRQRTHKGNWWSVCLGSVPGTVWGRIPPAIRRPDLIYVQFHMDWTECPRDRRDIFHGTKRDGMVAPLRSRSGGVPPNFFMFIGFLSSPFPCLSSGNGSYCKGADGRFSCRRCLYLQRSHLEFQLSGLEKGYPKKWSR